MPIAEFTSWGWVELKISLGELVIAVTTGLSAWWVSSIIQKRHASDLALRDLTASLCGDSLDLLHSLSDAIDSECSKAGGPVADVVRQKITRNFQRLTNSINTIEIAIEEAKFSPVKTALQTVKDEAETLRAQVLDPLVTNPGFDAAQLRQIEGTMRGLRESIIRLKFKVMTSGK